jgi:hypothetical protein
MYTIQLRLLLATGVRRTSSGPDFRESIGNNPILFVKSEVAQLISVRELLTYETNLLGGDGLSITLLLLLFILG